MHQQSQALIPAMLTIDDAVRYSGHARSRLYLDIKAGKLDVRKAGRRTLISRKSLDAMLDALPRASGFGDVQSATTGDDRRSPKVGSSSEHEDLARRNGARCRKKEPRYRRITDDQGAPRPTSGTEAA